MNISKNISYHEATRSRTATKYGIKNNPQTWQLKNMELLAEKIFQQVREFFNVPIYISSFFRGAELNKRIGGSKNSQHVSGEAMDLDDVYGGVTNKQIFDYIKDNLDFDQLINEFDYSWIHVSYKKTGNRNQILNAVKYKDSIGRVRTRYEKYEA